MNPHPSTIEVEALEEEAEEVLENDQEIENNQEIVDLFPPVSEEGGLNVTFTIEHTFSDDDNGDGILIDNDKCHGLYEEVEYDDMTILMMISFLIHLMMISFLIHQWNFWKCLSLMMMTKLQLWKQQQLVLLLRERLKM